MAKVIALVVLLGGCSMYFGDDGDEVAPDAAVVATPDSVTCDGLPSCASLYCGVGAIPLDCPRAEDTSVCYCPSPTPGWCRQ